MKNATQMLLYGKLYDGNETNQPNLQPEPNANLQKNPMVDK